MFPLVLHDADNNNILVTRPFVAIVGGHGDARCACRLWFGGDDYIGVRETVQDIQATMSMLAARARG